MTPALYADWKRGIVVDALRGHGLEVDVAPLEGVAAGSRRRATFGVRRTKKTVQLGFAMRRSHALVDLGECPVLEPAIVAALPGLRTLAGLLLARGGEGRIAVTRTDGAAGGLDVSVTGARSELPAERRQAVLAQAAAMGRAGGLARLTVDGDVWLAGAAPRVTLSGLPVDLPEGAFLQAVPAAEAALTKLVVAGVGDAARVADLFCGLGTFALALARHAVVMAWDGDRRAIAALGEAAQRTAGLERLTARRRDLFREPLSARELADYDAVVLDPPRAGCEAQARALAQAKVGRIVMVSCNPATLARDLRLLVDGGWRLKTVMPVDQFVWSAHVEVVALLARA